MLQKLRGTPDARQRVLDLMRQQRRHRRHRQACVAVHQLMPKTPRERPLFHGHHQLVRFVGKGRHFHGSQMPWEAWSLHSNVNLMDARPGATHLAYKSQKRAVRWQEIVQQAFPQKRTGSAKKLFGRRVGVEKTIGRIQEENRLAKCREQTGKVFRCLSKGVALPRLFRRHQAASACASRSKSSRIACFTLSGSVSRLMLSRKALAPCRPCAYQLRCFRAISSPFSPPCMEGFVTIFVIVRLLL